MSLERMCGIEVNYLSTANILFFCFHFLRKEKGKEEAGRRGGSLDCLAYMLS